MDPRYVTNASRKQAMPQKFEIDAYTADELTGSARERARQDWDVMQWDLYVADDISEYLDEELARKLPALAGMKVRWEVGFSQGDGVWLDGGQHLSDEQMRALAPRSFVAMDGDVSYTVSGRNFTRIEAEYWSDDADREKTISDIVDEANSTLSGIMYDLYGMARDYVMDAGSEEYWIDWADANDVLYDQSGRIIRQGSRKQAMPSDDLIDVDIEDYMGGDEGPDPDSQSGHAETALPYAGDNTKPAFSETGWTSKRRTSAMSDEEWNRAVEVDTEDMIYFLQEFKQLGSQVAGMNAQQMHDWYYRNWDDLTDEYGLAIDPDMIDWEEVAARVSKSASRKRRATRKTASGWYDYGNGVVELGQFGGDNQVGNSYGRIFVKKNEDGTYDRVDIGYYAAVNSVMGDEADELIAANEVYVEEQTWEWKGIADPETDESPTSIDYRNDMLWTNVSLAEAERLAEQYARELSARGDHIASRKNEVMTGLGVAAKRRKRSGRKTAAIQYHVVFSDGAIVGPYDEVNGAPEQMLFDDTIFNLGGDKNYAAEQYGKTWWIEKHDYEDDGEPREEFGPDTNTVMTGLGVTASRKNRGGNR